MKHDIGLGDEVFIDVLKTFGALPDSAQEEIRERVDLRIGNPVYRWYRGIPSIMRDPDYLRAYTWEMGKVMGLCPPGKGDPKRMEACEYTMLIVDGLDPEYRIALREKAEALREKPLFRNSYDIPEEGVAGIIETTGIVLRNMEDYSPQS